MRTHQPSDISTFARATVARRRAMISSLPAVSLFCRLAPDRARSLSASQPSLSGARSLSFPTFATRSFTTSDNRSHLEAEIARLEHELSVARAASVRPDDDAIFAAAAQLAAARQLTGRK
jgi:hypothetical protein